MTRNATTPCVEIGTATRYSMRFDNDDENACTPEELSAAHALDGTSYSKNRPSEVSRRYLPLAGSTVKTD